MSFAFVLFFNNVIGQKTVNLDTIENTVYLGKFKLKTPSSAAFPAWVVLGKAAGFPRSTQRMAPRRSSWACAAWGVRALSKVQHKPIPALKLPTGFSV